MATAAAAKEETAPRFAKDQPKASITRIEQREEEKKTISDDIRDVYGEAKGNGFDVQRVRTSVRRRERGGVVAAGAGGGGDGGVGRAE